MLIKTDKETIQSYFEDSSNVRGGWAEEVVFPESAEEICAFLEAASRQRRPVTISGGGTGTTGARVPFGGAVISVERLNRIIGISRGGSGEWAARVQAGVRVDDLKKAAEERGLFYTCHPTEGTATIGGTVATNASGSRSYRYGPTRKFIRSLTVVLPTGEILSLRRGSTILSKEHSTLALASGRSVTIPIPSYRMPAVKNASGYYARDGMDLIDLFIGQEGTLGVITEIEIALVPRPEKIFSCFAFFRSEEESWRFSFDARRLDPLSVEYFDSNAVEMLRTEGTAIPGAARAAIFFEKETEALGEDAAIGAWQSLFGKFGVSEEHVLAATTEREAEKLLEFRHMIPRTVNEMIRLRGVQKISTDIAVPDEHFVDMMRFYDESFAKTPLEHVIFGHIGESHVHANILPRDGSEVDAARALAMAFVRKGVAFGGTVSAEHGIGKIKHAYLEAMYGREGILQMAKIKKALDPSCILGLSNIFSKELLDEA